MVSTNRLIYALLSMIVLVILGMLTASWRVILYPYLFVIGISVLIGLISLIQSNRKFIWLPIGLVGLYLLLFIWLDVVSWGSPTGGGDSVNYVLGLVPSTAIFFLGIWPVSVLAPLLYAWTFTKDNSLASRVTESKYHGV